MSNKDIFLRRNENRIAELSNFSNKDDFNIHIRRVLYTYKGELGKILSEFVKYLSRYSMKYKGVSWQKVDTMAAGFGKSEPTVRRYLSKLSKLGIIGRVKAEKGSHYITYFKDDLELAELPDQTANTVDNGEHDREDDRLQMIDLKNSETSCESKTEGLNSIRETKTLKAKSKTKTLSNIRYKDGSNRKNDRVNEKPNDKTLDSSFVPNWVPNEFVEETSPFFNDANTITKLWTKAAYAARKLGLCSKNEGPNVYIETVIEAFKVTIYNAKRRAIRGSFYGYFFGVVSRMLRPFIYNTPRTVEQLEIFSAIIDNIKLEGGYCE